MTIYEFLKITNKILIADYVIVRPRIVCKDGFSVSVQAGLGLYSEPNKYIPTGEYTQVELGFPTNPLKVLNNDSEIYPYVEVEWVHNLLSIHGGIDIDKTFTSSWIATNCHLLSRDEINKLNTRWNKFKKIVTNKRKRNAR